MKILRRMSRGLDVARRFQRHVRDHRGGMVLAGSLSLCAAALEVLRPWPLKWIFDGALAPTGEPTTDPRSVVLLGAGAALLIVLLKLLAEYVATVRMAEVGQAVTRSLRLGLFRHLAELSPEFHARHKTGDLLVRLMGDVPMVRTMLVDSAIMITTRLVLMVATIGVMLWLDPALTVVVLAALPLLVASIRFLSRKITVAVRKQRAKDGELADFLQEALVANDVIQSLGGTDHTVKRFSRGNRSSVRAGLKAARAAARLTGWVDAILGLSTAATLLLGSLRVLDGALTPGELLVFLSYVRSLGMPARSSAKQMNKVAKGTACGERILEILERHDGLRSQSSGDPAPLAPSRLHFDHVSYAYATQDAAAVSDVDFSIERGEVVALFGPSGAGKSTLMRLALRLFDPSEGAIRIDGHPLTDLDIDSVRSRIGLAMQEAVLFGDTIRENLLLGSPEADDAELRAALESAGAWEFVGGLPEGLDTELGAAGSGLSGGERQRLCIARALLRGAPILLVDEPFAGLDERTARSLETTLKAAATDRIVLAITHDVSRLARFDRVVFLEGGQVVDEGSHEQLLERCTRYAEVCDLLREPAP